MTRSEIRDISATSSRSQILSFPDLEPHFTDCLTGSDDLAAGYFVHRRAICNCGRRGEWKWHRTEQPIKRGLGVWPRVPVLPRARENSSIPSHYLGRLGE